MLILNCTKAAADFFSTTKKGKKISVIESAPKQTIAEPITESMTNSNAPRQWQWLVHAIKVKGKHVLIAMDYQSRFSITLSELKKGDDSSFLNDLEHHLTVHVHETMTAINADSETIDTSLDIYRHQHHSRAFYLRGDRSVQAHINDVAWHFGRWADEMGGVPTEVDLISFDVFANQMLRKRKAEKDYFTPQREFLRGWLTHYGAHSTAEADECIDRLNAKERADSAARYPASMPSIENKGASLPSEAHPELGSNVISLDAYRKKNG